MMKINDVLGMYKAKMEMISKGMRNARTDVAIGALGGYYDEEDFFDNELFDITHEQGRKNLVYRVIYNLMVVREYPELYEIMMEMDVPLWSHKELWERLHEEFNADDSSVEISQLLELQRLHTMFDSCIMLIGIFEGRYVSPASITYGLCDDEGEYLQLKTRELLTECIDLHNDNLAK